MYKRKLNRLPGFDYSSNRFYFITIRVDNHYCAFGRIENKKMILSHDGTIAREQWIWLGHQYPYIEIITFMVMPDHVHGIIYIDNNQNKIVESNNNRDISIESVCKIKSLAELIGAYKTTVSKQIHLAGDNNFKWQKSYHDHIIRNNSELSRITNYIDNNPINWSV